MFLRFEVEYVLSEPTDSWKGRRGRIDACMLQNFLERPEDSKCLVCVCGPTGFTELAVQWVIVLISCIYTFEISEVVWGIFFTFWAMYWFVFLMYTFSQVSQRAGLQWRGNSHFSGLIGTLKWKMDFTYTYSTCISMHIKCTFPVKTKSCSTILLYCRIICRNLMPQSEACTEKQKFVS